MKKTLLISSLCLGSMALGAFITKSLENEAITIDIVKKAEKIIGLEFTQPEADSMLAKLTTTRKNFEENRKVELKNEVAPALVFNPLPQGFEFEKGASYFKASTIVKITLPKDKNELAFYSVRQLAALIQSKQITSLELTKFFLERLKKYDTQLACVVTLTEDLALKQASQADAEIATGKYKGLLHGIPYGAKDLLAKKGYKTTWGSVPYKDQVLDYDATVIQRLEKAGAVLCAKLTLGELAMGDVWFGGTTKNPWDLKRGSSGSSAGSASSVSAGLLPFAIGSETLGSIVSPSSECGDTGLRPTFGRVPRTGAMALSWSMDKLGPICRTVEDCAIVFNAILGEDGHDQSVMNAPFQFDGNKKDLKGIKIAYLKKDFEGKYPNKTQDSLTLVTMKKLGAELIPLELPNLPSSDISFLLTVEAAAAFDELTRSGKDDLMVRQVKNAWPTSFRAARLVPAVEYLQANRHRTLLIQEFNNRLKGIDVYLSPAFASRNLTMTNLTGHPCVVLPNGFRAEGRPTSITFMGKLFGEGKLLQVAKIYQDATDFHLKHPKL
ncbi:MULTISPECIES: amidase [unclassified Arcicella]|uniref:amidase n=1 Tax=unclassified Arcicella TaxID=2644986 RepID=UPI0028631FC7|nr:MULTISPECIES: amidase [unclassified Arcicella]MDR6564163.1 Asp-tRNA(Asn)/Glu-tRNA(Gln) amidotransferase A subunit family amidase [Arcicella sp. BE51]MDR6813916.1 Asp-tRNA(Asn)/Glu-tRNA(Gln) amidotransferase A subunit family amidase [Arcicella sp. BE140]MDR6825228.1 Asp-tRNA(Asn)/Glu-tRNA(Gln) amidotransferase A subunit family amidase [Arcicella sp. BE139]